MPLILPGNVASATAAVGYDVANSCRFNDDDGANLSKAYGGASDTNFTWSAWIKRCSPGGGTEAVFSHWNGSSDANRFVIYFEGDSLVAYHNNSGGSAADMYVKTTAVYRDPSAWYHFVVGVDTTQGTAGNRIKIYANGVQATDLSQTTYPDQNYAVFTFTDGGTTYIGRNPSSDSAPTKFFDGYMAEIFLIDGTTYAPSDFGEFNEDSPTIWQPKDCSGDLTFGTNGTYLDFEDSGNLGDDESGNGNDLAENSIVAADQATDSPTNNFCTMNPIDTATGFTMSEGSCKLAWSAAATNFGVTKATMGVSAGKWYFEVKYTFGNAGQFGVWDVNDTVTNSADVFSEAGNSTFEGLAWRIDTSANIKECADGQTDDTGDDFTSENILGIAFDADAGKIYAFQNNTEITNQGIGAGTSLMTAVTVSDFYLPFVSGGDGGSGTKTHTSEVNFGGCPSFALSSAAADGNGYGAFEYAPPSGFLALCSKNLGSDGG